MTKIFLNTTRVSEMLGIHRNTLTNPKYSEILKPKKHSNGRDNLYDPEIVEAYIAKRKEEDPDVVFPFEIENS